MDCDPKPDRTVCRDCHDLELWDLSGHLTGTPGQVLWARGTHYIDDMTKVGLPAPEFLEANKT
jgi:hypothetical protein